jgi:para-aminobenzoate synthetase component 1
LIASRERLPIVHEIEPVPDCWQAFLRLRSLGETLFLDSAMTHRAFGRYSFIASDPFKTLRLGAERDADPHGRDPFIEIEALLDHYRTPAVPDLPPFQGGVGGVFGYGLGRFFERLPAARRDVGGLPDLRVAVFDWVLAVDHVEKRAWVISQGFPETEPSKREQRARQRLERVLTTLDLPEPPAMVSAGSTPELRWPHQSHALDGCPDVSSNFEREAYLEAVRKAVRYIHAGDVFQVNLSQQLVCPAWISALELYGRLRERNPSPFSAWYEPTDEDFVIASASPERFLRASTSGEVETRPIKGTRPRKAHPLEDGYVRESLYESGKDRSENVMIVDLLRNDLSRVCRPGSVKVSDLYRLESYPTVHHLVSVVEGRLRDRLGPVDLLRASFPGGSITGAPKIRAMEIINELEPDARGAYCGSLGYIAFSGAMDSSILIRTVTALPGWFQFPVGGGIVAASTPEREYQETLDKAQGILRALK